MKFGLRNIITLLRYVGNPHRKFKSVHVAGTNGKGSTSSMIAAILTAAGYKVGLYTSPHLVKFNERIRINGKMISDGDIVRYTKKLIPLIHRLKATFFETTTAIAFKYFADRKVDIAVIETGLGGRLDSTNVLKPLVSVITSIGIDHTELLGKTISLIAGEKAGIIKHNTPVIIGRLNRAALRVVTNKAKKKQAPLILSSKIKLPDNVSLQLKGKHQTDNAKGAVAAVSMLSNNYLIGDKAIRCGLEQTSKFTGLRARFELIKGKPDILLDVAHNPGGIKILVAELKKLPYKKFVVVFAVMKDKEFHSMIGLLKKMKPVIIATQPHIERALPSEKLHEFLQKRDMSSVHKSTVAEAVKAGKKLADKDGILVITGSHYVVGEAIQLLKN